MRLLAQCDDRGHAETIERALQHHHGLKIVATERLVTEDKDGKKV